MLYGNSKYTQNPFCWQTWEDRNKLLPDPLGRAVAEQLIRSAGSICVNTEEGYGRGFGRDFARLLRFSLAAPPEKPEDGAMAFGICLATLC